MQKAVSDIRDILFEKIRNKKITAKILVEKEGIIAGTTKAGEKLEGLGLSISFLATEGLIVSPGMEVARFTGTPKEITSAEDIVIGNLTKASGIATAAHRAVDLASGRIRIVSGAWKKMPIEIKEMVREAVKTGGASFRITDDPFVYLDKNYVRIFGGIKATLEAVSKLSGYTKVIQLRGETAAISEEAEQAVLGGADILMVDTGCLEDALQVINKLKSMSVRDKKLLAFAGGINIADIPVYCEHGFDILDIGVQIIDAPLLDMKMDVISI
ncbi:MAG: quinolinate phosphoribosyl transferase [Bacillota bacterium]